MKTIAVLVLLAMCFLIGGCSPGASDGKQIIETRIQQQSNGLIKLVSFKKTNGQAMEPMGIKAYTMNYTAEIEFLDDCTWGSGGALGWPGTFAAVRGRPNPMFINFSASEVKKGQRVTVSGEFVFQKTEQGWQLSQ